MSKHMKFVVSVLFAVILLLAAAITKFYSDTGQSLHEGSNGVEIEKKLGSDSAGNRIFQDSSGLYGVIDSNERVIVSPEWIELDFTDNNLCIASKRINGKLMTGCIDYDGNIAVPLIYRNIIPYSFGDFKFYIANPDADSSCVLYDENFYPLFTRSWDASTISENELLLTGGSASYTYTLGSDGFTMKKASLRGKAFEYGFTMNIYDRKLLEQLDPDMLEEIIKSVGHYIEFAFTGSSEYIADMRTTSKPVFSVLFPNEKKILSKKLTGIPSVGIRSVQSKDGSPCFSVTVTAATEIVYSDSKDKPHTLNDKYKAVMEFTGSSSNDLAAASGAFEESTLTLPDGDKPNDKTKPTV